MGAIRMLMSVGVILEPEYRFCVPQGVTVRRGVAVLLKYLDQRPQRWHENFLDLAIEAYGATWPCR